MVLLRPSADDLPPVQLILSPNGWTWHFHPATRDSMSIEDLCFFAIFTPMYFLWFRASPRVILVFATIFAILFGCASLWRYRRARRLRHQGVKHLGDTAIVMTPWEPASQISIKPLHPGTWLVVLTQDKD